MRCYIMNIVFNPDSWKIILTVIVSLFFIAGGISGDDGYFLPKMMRRAVFRARKFLGFSPREPEKPSPVSYASAPATYKPPANQVGRFVSENYAVEAFGNAIKRRGGDPSLILRNNRPAWLKNPKTGRSLELDAVYEPWKLALEYNGEQHYVFPNLYHPDTPKGKEDHELQKQRDQHKANIVKEYGYHLIIIPYHVDTQKLTPKGYVKLQRPPHERIAVLEAFIEACWPDTI